MSILIAHLSDAHFKTDKDPLVLRRLILAKAIAGEVDGSVKACVIAFTGDATDKGSVSGFNVAGKFFADLLHDLGSLTSLVPELILIPGNHDVVGPSDPSLRDMAINSLGDAASRPKKAVEEVILGPLSHYFGFAAGIKGAASPSASQPYYVCCDRTLDGRSVRFHLLNSAWM